MTAHQVILCQTCAVGRVDLTEALTAALVGSGFDLTQTACMSGCARPSTVAFRAAGKTAYLFGDLGPQDIDDLARFARLYRDSPDGTFADARVLGDLRHKAIARIPG
jgi:predicted metal-binding protein